jgi:hypothetical protein
MAIFNSHKHKKFNRYTAAPSARKNGFPPYLIIILSALAAVIAALLLGTFLGELADSAPSKEENNQTDPKDFPSLLDTERINGVFVTLDGITDSTAQSVKAQIPAGSTAVSLKLFDTNGDPLYRSHVAEAFENKCGELTLSRVFEGVVADGNTLYSSVIFPSFALNNTDSAKDAVINAYEAALIEELSLAGACDVIITPFDFGNTEYKLSDDFAKRLLAYVISVRALSPELRIGLALPLEYLVNTDHSLLIEDISKTVDFIALDLTDKTELEPFTDAISDASLNILRRDVRILLAEKSEKDLLALTTLLDKYSMSNYQVVLRLD